MTDHVTSHILKFEALNSCK